MTHSERSQDALRQAAALCDQHPWTIVSLLVRAVVFALLAVSVAIESAGHER